MTLSEVTSSSSSSSSISNDSGRIAQHMFDIRLRTGQRGKQVKGYPLAQL